MSARLVGWIAGTGRVEREIAGVARVGATADNEIVVRVEGVSREHARISEEADGFWIEDTKSRNGTWVNGERTTRTKLQHLDVITFGRFADLVFVARAGEAAPEAPALRVRITWLNGPAAGQQVEVARGESILGRADSCNIIIDDASVSRAHARLTHSGGSVSIEDLGSANGISVNEQQLSAAVALEPDDVVEIGDRRFKVLIDGEGRRPSSAVQGATPIAAQDMEWMTKLVWSESDLEVVRAAVAAGKPAAAKSGAGQPGKPAAPAAAPRPAAAPGAGQPAAAAPTVVSAGTQLGTPSLGAPPLPPAAGAAPSSPATVIATPGTLPVPDFKGQPPAPGSDHTMLGVSPVSLPPGLKGPPKPAAPVASGPEGSGSGGRRPIERPDLPPSTVLGYRDVAPSPRVAPPAAPSSTPEPRSSGERGADAGAAPIRAIRLSGAVGTFELPRGTNTIGRSEQATVRIDSRDVSRIHANLTVTESGAMLENLGSNGTVVNGTLIKGALALTDGDRVAIADIEFLVEVLRMETNQGPRP
jgi:pSer/pThr/pTyr-binding forkhead associated (FHA) protein